MAPVDEIRVAILCILLALLPRDFVLGELTRVEVSVRGAPIVEGGLLVVQCQMWNRVERSMVNLELIKPDGSSILIATGQNSVGIMNDVGERHYLSTRRFNDGSVVYFLTVTRLTSWDEGRYMCTSIQTGPPPVIVDDYRDVRLHEFPRSDPDCDGNPSNPINLAQNPIVMLTCSSPVANPVQNITWHFGVDTKSADISTRQWISNGRIFSEMRYSVQKADQWAIFMCEISSDMFPGRERTCHIGPLGVVPGGDTRPQVTAARPVIPGRNPNDISPVANGALTCPDTKAACDNEPYTNKFLILAFTTVATTLLCLIFLITTLVMCCKVRTKENILKNQQKQTTTVVRRRPHSGRSGARYSSAPQNAGGGETVYVKMQRNSVGNAEPVYMTLEPPTLPPSLTRPTRMAAARQASMDNYDNATTIVLPMVQGNSSLKKDSSPPTGTGGRGNRPTSVVIPKEFFDRYTVTLPKNSVIKMDEYSDKIQSIED